MPIRLPQLHASKSQPPRGPTGGCCQAVSVKGFTLQMKVGYDHDAADRQHGRFFTVASITFLGPCLG